MRGPVIAGGNLQGEPGLLRPSEPESQAESQFTAYTGAAKSTAMGNFQVFSCSNGRGTVRQTSMRTHRTMRNKALDCQDIEMLSTRTRESVATNGLEALTPFASTATQEIPRRVCSDCRKDIAENVETAPVFGVAVSIVGCVVPISKTFTALELAEMSDFTTKRYQCPAVAVPFVCHAPAPAPFPF